MAGAPRRSEVSIAKTLSLADGRTHPVVFYGAVRLAQDPEKEGLQGRRFIAKRGGVAGALYQHHFHAQRSWPQSSADQR